jgi:hypothetical protein
MSDRDTFELFCTRADGKRQLIGQGAWGSICDHIPDSHTIRQKLTIINDAAHAEGKLLEIRRRERDIVAREDSVKAREDAVAEAEAAMLQDAISKLDDRARKMDSEEARRIQAAIDALPDPDDPASYQRDKETAA